MTDTPRVKCDGSAGACARTCAERDTLTAMCYEFESQIAGLESELENERVENADLAGSLVEAEQHILELQAQLDDTTSFGYLAELLAQNKRLTEERDAAQLALSATAGYEAAYRAGWDSAIAAAAQTCENRAHKIERNVIRLREHGGRPDLPRLTARHTAMLDCAEDIRQLALADDTSGSDKP